jgi:Purple acid Phosphatase, N-terminal domain
MKHPYRSRVFLVVAVSLTLSLPAIAQLRQYKPAPVEPPAKKAAQVQITKGPELELFRNNEAIIRWTSNNPGGSDEHFGIVRYGTDPQHLNLIAKSHIRLNREHPYTIFRVRVENVKPGTTYYYSVSSMNADNTEDAVKSGVYHFTTTATAPPRWKGAT